MYKNLIKSICIAGLLTGCNTHPANNEILIKGNFNQPFTGTIYLGHITDRFQYDDSIKVEHATEFSMLHAIDQTDNYRIVMKPNFITREIIAQGGGTYQIDYDTKAQTATLTTENAPEQQLMEQFENIQDEFAEVGAKLSTAYEKISESGDKDRLKQLSDSMTTVFNKEQQKLVAFIKSCPTTYAAVYTASKLLTKEFPLLNEVYQTIDTLSYRETNAYQSFKTNYTTQKSMWMEGTMAPVFTTKDIHGKTVKLEDFRGKYVLLDFWASWCQSCRLKAKDIKKIYSELNKKGIVMLSVSLDEKKADWLKASQEDGINWTNTCELCSFNKNKIAQDYKVKFIPSLFLIGPKGEIMKQDPSVEYLLNFSTK